MVLTGFIVSLPIIAFFTMDVNINKLKVYNIEDKAKAKLTAESGLKFAMTRLRLYKEAYNYLQNNKNAQDLVKAETLNIIWNIPFAYPVPKQESLNRTQKDTIDEFNENISLDGSLQVTINNISNKVNLNLLRVSLMNQAAKTKKEDEEEEEDEENEYNVESQLYKLIQNKIEAKSAEDDNFNSTYYGMDISLLINELKYYVSDPDTLESSAGDAGFVDINEKAKQGPMNSLSELYALPSWPDDITNLILNVL